MRFYLDKRKSGAVLRCDRFTDVWGNPLDFEIVLKYVSDAEQIEDKFLCWCVDHTEEWETELDEPSVFNGHHYMDCIPRDLRYLARGTVWIFRHEDLYIRDLVSYTLYVIVIDVVDEDKFLVVVRLLESRFVDSE